MTLVSRRAVLAGAGTGVAAGLLLPATAMADGHAYQWKRTISPGATVEETIKDCQADQSVVAKWRYDYAQAPGSLYISTAVRQEGKTCYRALVHNERDQVRLRLERCAPTGTTVLAEGPAVAVSSYSGLRDWVLRTTVKGDRLEAVVDGVPGMQLSATDPSITQGTQVSQTYYLSKRARTSTDVRNNSLKVSSTAAATSNGFSKLLYEDTFSTGTDFDPRYWGEQYPTWNPGYVKYDWGVVVHDAHDVKDGVGRILWRKRTTPITRWPNPKDQEAGISPTVRDVDTANIVTRGKLEVTYGRVEVRARFPQSHVGLWGGIWMRPTDGGDGEIDIAESWGGGASTGRVTADVHYTYSAVSGRHRQVPVEPRPDLTQFHVFAMEKTPEHIRFFFDGSPFPFHEVTSQEYPDRWAKAFGPDKPYYLRLCSQAGDSLKTKIDTTTFTEAAMEIDYIKVWAMDQ